MKESEIIEYGRIVYPALLHGNRIYMGLGCHADIFPMEELGVLRCDPQGFVTKNGYFVDRAVAFIIATYYDQIDVKHPLYDELYSEDLKVEDEKYINKREGYIYLLSKTTIAYKYQKILQLKK